MVSGRTNTPSRREYHVLLTRLSSSTRNRSSPTPFDSIRWMARPAAPPSRPALACGWPNGEPARESPAASGQLYRRNSNRARIALLAQDDRDIVDGVRKADWRTPNKYDTHN